MADLDRIKSNVAKMAAQNAPEADIDGYIASEGVTIDAIRAHKMGAAEPEGGSFMDPLMQGVMLGGADEFRAGVRSAFIAPFVDETIGEVYDQELSDTRGNLDAYRERNPVTSTALEVAGSLAPAIGTGGAGVVATAGRGIGTRMGAGMASGGAIGGTQGFLSNEGDERGAGAGAGAALGATIGGAIPAVGGLAAKAFRKSPPPAPSLDALKSEADTFYASARAQNPVFPKSEVSGWVSSLERTLAEEGIDKTVHPKATAALRRIQQSKDDSVTFQHLERLRQVAQAAGKDPGTDEARMAGMIVEKIDDLVGTSSVFDDVAAGRQAWHRFKKGERLEVASTRAADRAASTGSGGNIENAMRQEVRRILDSPRQLRGYTEDEVTAMRDIVRGTPVQNALRQAGKLSPQGNGLMAALLLGSSMANAPVAVAVGAGGAAAKASADKLTRKNIDRLKTLIRNGGMKPKQAETMISGFLEREAQRAVGAVAPAGAYLNQ